MRLGLLISGDLGLTTGGYIYDRRLVDHLRRSGHEVFVVPLSAHDYASRLAHCLDFSFCHQVEELHLDLLLEDELDHVALFALNRKIKSRNSRLPIVAIVHHLRSSEQRPAWQNRLYRLPEGAYLNSVDAFIFNSLTTSLQVKAMLGQPRPSLVASPSANLIAPDLDIPELLARTHSPGPLKLLFVGSLVPRKGLHVLLESMALLPADSCGLNVVGNPELDKKYVASVRHLAGLRGLVERINWLGTLSDSALAFQFQQSHVLAVPSSYEGFGMVYLEAMAFGLPPIGASAGGAGEIIVHGRNGFLLRAGDSRALAAHLSALQQDRTTLARLSLDARQTYLSHPSWEESGRAIAAFLESLPPRSLPTT